MSIAHIFQQYNEARVYSLWDEARTAYQEWRWVSGKSADVSAECGECEDKCPQHIPIREQLTEAHDALKASR